MTSINENPDPNDNEYVRSELPWGLVWTWPFIWFGLSWAWCLTRNGELSSLELILRKLWLWCPLIMLVFCLFYSKETRKKTLVGLGLMLIVGYGQFLFGMITGGALGLAISRFLHIFLHQN